MMNYALTIPNLVSLLLLILIWNHPIETSAHFYLNGSSIPLSSLPNKTAWSGFKNFTGCHKGVKADGLHNLKKYFQYFGYLNSSYDDFSDQFDGNFELAVKTYQQNFKLNSTGELDNSTLSHIVLPRCGNPDIVNGTSTMLSGSGRSSSSYTGTVAHYSFFPNQPRWPRDRRDLTYAFLTENQLSETVRGVFSRAFQRWAQVVPMTFTETTSFMRADIRIGFYNGDHGDGEPFDGVLGTLAHAFAPPVGRFHLDGEENWVIDGDFNNDSPYSAIDLESVAVHEIGHLLGLGHSSVEEAIMYPTISSGVRKVVLDADDITGVQELYGANPNYNGSDPDMNSGRGQRDSSGATPVSLPMFGLELLLVLVVGIFSLLF